LEKGAIIRAEKIPDDLPQTFLGSIIEKDKTKSTIIIPLSIGNKVIGIMSFSSYREERKWPDDVVKRIKLIGEIIANAILRIRSHKSLLEEMDRRKKLEERYTSIIKTANVGFMISDLNAKIIDVNDTYSEMSGYSRDELLGMTIYQLDVSHNFSKVKNDLQGIYKTGSFHHETNHIRKDGKIINVLISANLIKNEGIVFSFIRDITELNKARRDLEDRLKFEELISHFSATLINVKPDDINEELNNWLKMFVEFLNVDRGMFHEYDYGNQIVNILLSYTEPDIDVIVPPLVENHRPPDEIMKEFAKGVIIRADRIPEDLPPLFRGGLIEYHHTKSVVIVPLTSGDQVIGNLTFADYRKEHEWHDELIRRIKLMGEIVANAILRKRSHEALLEEMKSRHLLEEKYTSIIKNASVGFVLSDHNQNILDVNDEYCRMSGYSHNELIKMRIADIDFSEDPEKKVNDDIALTVESESGLYHHLTRHIHKSGRIFEVEVDTQYSESEGFFFSFVRDVTELNRARRELEERLEFEKFVSEFSATLINVKLDDISKEINHWLERFVKLLNVDRCIISEYQDNFSKLNFIFSYTNPEVEAEIRPLSPEPVETYGYHLYLQRGEIIQYESPYDTFPEDIRQGLLESVKDGTKSLLLVPLKAGDILLGVMSISTVISEMKWTQEIMRRLRLVAEIFANALMRDRTNSELETYRKDLEDLVNERTARLKEAQQELILSEKMATLGRLTATVSHELRNPLGTIRSSLFSVNKRLKSQDEKTEKALERAERSVQRCDIIIEELLDYSRAQPLNLRRTDIDNWLNELFEEEKPPIDITLEKELNAGVSIEVDRDRFRRCIINILTNAYQSIQEKSDKLQPGCVRVITKRDESGMKIEISDNGTGFDQKDISKFFEPLYSTKTFGVGLGIPITKQILAMHGWDMDMNGEPGKGALVTIRIPIS
ncbi:MAG: PAS domain S-box protein, partial [Deltaproteobacteria bacterium]|nr:PAS domain S-box protein [Deltaproteobacteria bacterium]